MAKKEKRPPPSALLRLDWIGADGRTGVFLAGPEGAAVYAMPVIWLVVALWVVTIFFTFWLPFDNLLINMLIGAAGGLCACLVILRFCHGRPLYRLPYGELTSMVRGTQELTVNCTNHQMIMLRMSPAKQQRLFAAFPELLAQSGRYRAEPDGEYLRFRERDTPTRKTK